MGIFKKIKLLARADHRPIQMYFAVLWFLYGIVSLILNKHLGYISIISSKIGAVGLILASFIGFYGAIFNSVKPSWIFATFTLYKNVEGCIFTFGTNGWDNLLWVNDVAQLLASIVLTYKIIFLVFFANSKNDQQQY